MPKRALSSPGRAPVLHSGGKEFESPSVHKLMSKVRFFEEILKEICLEENIEMKVLSNGWMLEFFYLGNYYYTAGYDFGLNSSVVTKIIDDKVLTSVILTKNKIPHIHHLYLPQKKIRENLNFETTEEEDFQNVLKELELPVVVKPINGKSGSKVFFCDTYEEFIENTNFILETSNVAVSKFYESEFEYRVYILNDRILFGYKKNRVSSWQHNLSMGAIPTKLEPGEIQRLEKIVTSVVEATNVKCGAIDFLDGKDGLKVLEINNGISMDNFAKRSAEYRQLAKEAHRAYLSEVLGKEN